MGPPKISQTNNNMGPKLWKTQHPKLQFTYPLWTLPFCTSLHSLSQPLHILNYQKTFTSQVFPQVSLRSTIVHADIYTYPNTPTWQTHMVLISWKSQPCPSVLDKPAPTHCYTGSIYIHTRTATVVTVIDSKQVRWCNSPGVCGTKEMTEAHCFWFRLLGRKTSHWIKYTLKSQKEENDE